MKAALTEACADAVVVVFITGAVKGERLERADYYLQHEGTMMYNDWFSPQITEVYTVHEGAGYYEQERTLFLESRYLVFPSQEARWTMITESSALEYRAGAGPAFGEEGHAGLIVCRLVGHMDLGANPNVEIEGTYEEAY